MIIDTNCLQVDSFAFPRPRGPRTLYRPRRRHCTPALLIVMLRKTSSMPAMSTGDNNKRDPIRPEFRHDRAPSSPFSQEFAGDCSAKESVPAYQSHS